MTEKDKSRLLELGQQLSTLGTEFRIAQLGLEKAVEGSHIRMVSQLQPRNVPRPAPRPVPEFERKDDREDEREDEEGNALLGQDA